MKYVGTELHLFEQVVHWKKYWSSVIKPYMRGSVLEVGAGIGSNTPLFSGTGFTRWTCLEPDKELLQEARERLREGQYEFVSGTISDVQGHFDVIFYIDVLEHIKDDEDEMLRASERLRSGGSLIILVPAHQWLYSPFDAEVGHHRRYTTQTLARIMPQNLQLERLVYLDSVGLLASSANRLLLHQRMPTAGQLRVWDSFLVPLSRVVDPLIGHSLGKSVLGIWRKSI